VIYIYEQGLMTGTGTHTFGPGLPMTRAMIVIVLWRFAGELEAPASGFGDLSWDWYRNAVDWAAESGIVTGYDETCFRPNTPVTREQLVAILYRHVIYIGYDVSVGEETNILSYTDAFDISEYAIPAFQWACGAGIIEGSNNSLDPQGLATRAQVAAILMRFMEDIAK
jgi:hypothetical protein